jgi:hypothetical protein
VKVPLVRTISEGSGEVDGWYQRDELLTSGDDVANTEAVFVGNPCISTAEERTSDAWV